MGVEALKVETEALRPAGILPDGTSSGKAPQWRWHLNLNQKMSCVREGHLGAEEAAGPEVGTLRAHDW